MSITISIPDNQPEVQLTPKIAVIGVGGAGGNAVNNMIESGMEGVRFIVANTDAQALQNSKASERIQLGINTTGGLGAGSKPETGKKAAEETEEKISEIIDGLNMLFIAAGMGGGTGTGAAPVIAQIAKEKGILTVAVATKPFHFEGKPRMRTAEAGIEELSRNVDTLLIIPNQKLFSLPGEDLTIQDAFKKVDDVLSCGIKSITDLMMIPGFINLDFADVKTALEGMGRAMMGTGEESGEDRAKRAAEKAITNPLLDSNDISDAKAIMVNITCGPTCKITEIDEAVTYIKDSANVETNIMHGLRYDQALGDTIRISVVATGISENSKENLKKEVQKTPFQAIVDRKIPFHTSENNEASNKTSPFMNEPKEEIITLTEVSDEPKAEEVEEITQSTTILSMPSARDLFKGISVKEPEQQTMSFLNPQVIPMNIGNNSLKSHDDASIVKETKNENSAFTLNAIREDIASSSMTKPATSSLIEDIPSFFNEKIPSFFGRK